jgi:hypothetical protein
MPKGNQIKRGKTLRGGIRTRRGRAGWVYGFLLEVPTGGPGKSTATEWPPHIAQKPALMPAIATTAVCGTGCCAKQANGSNSMAEYQHLSPNHGLPTSRAGGTVNRGRNEDIDDSIYDFSMPSKPYSGELACFFPAGA